ncbi:MAG: VWA domain-containing protein [Candidatus Accumulibacter sp.]|jgi:uncharacterized protein YegL|nr:VWA domain-containing protein [Candidatus Accumulibacter propinquus]
MRRLPVFFVLDCSESMVGENLKKMEDGLAAIVKTLRTDPHALETVHLSVIAFAGVARTIVPLVELVSFYPPKLPLGGGTNLAAALDTLMNEIDKSVIRTNAERKGDWQPIVYLFTDGRPTDKPDQAIGRWLSRYSRKATLIAVGLGRSADLAVLRRLTENVIIFEDSREGDFTKFIDWVTASLVAQSKSVGEGANAQGIPILDESVMRIIKEPPSQIVDEACVTLVGRCRKTRCAYIIKYEKAVQDVATRDFKVQVSHFDIAGCYPLEEAYFAWTEPGAVDLQVNTSELVGSPGCPHCGAVTAFAVCGCGRLMCINGPGEVVCPWCEKEVSFSPVQAGDDGFAVGRGRG